MNLAKELLRQISEPAREHSERALLRCKLAKHLEGIGDYEGARRVMGDLWQRIGERPTLAGLDEFAMAEVLLQAGVLTGGIGSVNQYEGAQEIAKNLISESMEIFEALQKNEKVAEAQSNLAICYWREGAFNEARVILQEALGRLAGADNEQKAVTLLRSAIVEGSANRYNDALHIYIESAPLFEKSDNHVLKGKFHHGLAYVLRNLSLIEERRDYIDRALIEYTAASFHFDLAGYTRHHACVENNLGFLFLTVGRFDDAHNHLDRAQALFTTLKDCVHLAQVDDTRARVLLAESRVVEAEKLVRAAVTALEKGGEQSLLVEALTTHGIALARLGKHERARLALRSALEIARHAGDSESAGRAGLTAIEELGDYVSNAELWATYEVAAELLADSRNMTTHKRLAACARRVLFLVRVRPAPPDWTNFSFKAALRRFEAGLIERALKDADGSVTRAARLLGFKHHHSLASIINNRHRNLLSERKPVVHRRRSLIAERSDELAPGGHAGGKASRPFTILHVEDSEVLAGVVREALELEGWAVETCADGAEALERISGPEEFNLMILDCELPGVHGVELVRHARR